jgi:general secretion pathway protein H
MRMPTSGIDYVCTARTAGFTLVELLAVLAVLALAVTAFSFGAGKSLETANFRALMVKTSAAISAARTDAISGARERVFLVDLKRRRLEYPEAGVSLKLPPGVELTATVAESERHDDGTAGIRFYPTGSSSGGALLFKFRNQTFEIDVNWLTGNASLHRV